MTHNHIYGKCPFEEMNRLRRKSGDKHLGQKYMVLASLTTVLIYLGVILFSSMYGFAGVAAGYMFIPSLCIGFFGWALYFKWSVDKDEDKI